MNDDTQLAIGTIAQIIATIPDQKTRRRIALRFAEFLKVFNPQFDGVRFYRRCIGQEHHS